MDNKELREKIFNIVGQYDGAEGGYSDQLTDELLDLIKQQKTQMIDAVQELKMTNESYPIDPQIEAQLKKFIADCVEHGYQDGLMKLKNPGEKCMDYFDIKFKELSTLLNTEIEKNNTNEVDDAIYKILIESNQGELEGSTFMINKATRELTALMKKYQEKEINEVIEELRAGIWFDLPSAEAKIRWYKEVDWMLQRRGMLHPLPKSEKDSK